jgi:hypothetical protein
VKNCSQPNEEVLVDIEELCRQKPDYWTLIIARQGTDHEPASE